MIASELLTGTAARKLSFFVLWDIVAETGIFRLLGHTSGVTDIHFVSLHDGEIDVLGEGGGKSFYDEFFRGFRMVYEILCQKY